MDEILILILILIRVCLSFRSGMVDSKEFAVGIFDALVRRRHQSIERITKEEFYDFWMQISDQSFDARLQIFFDMLVFYLENIFLDKNSLQLLSLATELFLFLFGLFWMFL